LVRRFLDGLRDEEARFEVEFHKEPTTIDEAVFHIVNFIQTKSRNENDRRLHKGARRAFDDDQFRCKDGACLYEVPSARYTRATRSDSETVNFGVSNNTDDGSMQCKKEESAEQGFVLEAIMKRLEKLEENVIKEKSKSNRKVDITCFNCQRVGHMARECPDKRNIGKQKKMETVSNINQRPLNYMGPTLGAKGRSVQKRN
jgi:hypothetical protein